MPQRGQRRESDVEQQQPPLNHAAGLGVSCLCVSALWSDRAVARACERATVACGGRREATLEEESRNFSPYPDRGSYYFTVYALYRQLNGAENGQTRRRAGRVERFHRSVTSTPMTRLVGSSASRRDHAAFAQGAGQPALPRRGLSAKRQAVEEQDQISHPLPTASSTVRVRKAHADRH